jgi:hypothetical protein
LAVESGGYHALMYTYGFSNETRGHTTQDYGFTMTVWRYFIRGYHFILSKHWAGGIWDESNIGVGCASGLWQCEISSERERAAKTLIVSKLFYSYLMIMTYFNLLLREVSPLIATYYQHVSLNITAYYFGWAHL